MAQSETERTTPDIIRVMIAETQGIVLHALQILLQSMGNIEVIGIATDGSDLLRQLELAKPHVILLDVRKPGMTAIDVTRTIDAKMPWVRVISLSDHNHPVFIKEMLKNGARGFLSKNCSIEELNEGIRKVTGGNTFFCRECTQVLLRDYTAPEETAGVDIRAVTAREIEIIGFLSEGYTTKEISDKLYISSKTVERHKSNLLKKLKLRNTAHLVRVAVENGLLIV